MVSSRRPIAASIPADAASCELAFPTEDGRGLALSLADVRALLERPSGYYAALSAAIARRMAAEMGIPAPAGGVLARDPAVLLAYLFLDRTIRVARLVERHGAQSLAVIEAPDEPAGRLERLRGDSSQSARFNQAVLCRAAEAWDLPRAAAPAGLFPPRKPAGRAPVNNNFVAPDLRRRLKWKLSRLLSRRWGRVAALGLSYSTENFLDGLMFWPGRLAELAGSYPPRLGADADLRRRVLAPALDETAGAWSELLASFGVTAAAAGKSASAWKEFALVHYPTTLLEDAPENLAKARAELAPFAGSSLFFSETGDVRSQTMLAAAKEIGLRTVEFQHGAHYGFAPHPVFIEQEFAHCDAFVSWGWTTLPDHPLTRGVKTMPMPAPWLSDRRRRWARALRGGGSRPRDILLLTDKLFHFPPTLYTNRAGRMDFLPEYSRRLEALARGLAGAGLKVLHKPFDRMSAEAQERTIARLRKDLGGLYSLDEEFDKGLTDRLLREAKVTVWDEPGTGWFECLTSGIPALLIWPRLPCGEEPYARPAFVGLEQTGVVHSSVESLVAEAARCAEDPAAWLAEPRRARAVDAACRLYAWTEDDWAGRWRKFLSRL